jgi:hypothetical protein
VKRSLVSLPKRTFGRSLQVDSFNLSFFGFFGLVATCLMLFHVVGHSCGVSGVESFDVI